jgi:hypothetical protein
VENVGVIGCKAFGPEESADDFPEIIKRSYRIA